VNSPNNPDGIVEDGNKTITGEPDDSFITDIDITSDADTLVPGLPDEEFGIVYHNIDPSLLSLQGEPVRAPYGYWFAQRLTLLANNEIDINLNNGVRWDNVQFGREDVENALQASVNDPVLLNGDCIFEQYVLFDESTGRPIAYQNAYTYFTLETMMFQHQFNVFFFSLDDFTRRDRGVSVFEQSENIVRLMSSCRQSFP